MGARHWGLASMSIKLNAAEMLAAGGMPGRGLVLRGQTTFSLHGTYRLEIISACLKKGPQVSHSYWDPWDMGRVNWFHVTSGASYIEFFHC